MSKSVQTSISVKYVRCRQFQHTPYRCINCTNSIESLDDRFRAAKTCKKGDQEKSVSVQADMLYRMNFEIIVSRAIDDGICESCMESS